MWYVHLKSGEEQSVLLRVLGIRLCCLLGKSDLFPAAVKKVAWRDVGKLLHKQGPLIFREEEIACGCAVSVACPSCLAHSPEPPGPRRKIRNMLGWSQMETSVRSGIWLFRGALQGESVFSALVAAGDWVRKGSYHTAWSVLSGSLCTCRARPRYWAM